MLIASSCLSVRSFGLSNEGDLTHWIDHDRARTFVDPECFECRSISVQCDDGSAISLFAMNFVTTASGSSSRATKTNFLGSTEASNSFMWGIDAIHGPHQVAQKSMTTVFPTSAAGLRDGWGFVRICDTRMTGARSPILGSPQAVHQEQKKAIDQQPASGDLPPEGTRSLCASRRSRARDKSCSLGSHRVRSAVPGTG